MIKYPKLEKAFDIKNTQKLLFFKDICSAQTDVIAEILITFFVGFFFQNLHWSSMKISKKKRKKYNPVKCSHVLSI